MKRITQCKCAKCGSQNVAFVAARLDGEAVEFDARLYIEGSTDERFKADTFMNEETVREMVTGTENLTFTCMDCIEYETTFDILFNDGVQVTKTITDGKDLLLELLGPNAFHPDTPMWSAIDMYCFMSETVKK